jgi:hypothetical protein
MIMIDSVHSLAMRIRTWSYIIRRSAGIDIRLCCRCCVADGAVWSVVLWLVRSAGLWWSLVLSAEIVEGQYVVSLSHVGL